MAQPRARRSTNVRPTDEELLDAMAPAVAQLGCGVVTMDELASRADTTKQTLYAHFTSKDALLRQIQEREYDILRERLFSTYDEVGRNVDLTNRIRACIRPFYAYAAERPDGIRILLDETAPGFTEHLRATFGEIVTRATAGAPIAVAADSAAAHVIASMLVAAAFGGNVATLERSDVTPELATELTTMFLVGGLERLSTI